MRNSLTHQRPVKLADQASSIQQEIPVSLIQHKVRFTHNLYILCFVMGYELHLGEIAHNEYITVITIHYTTREKTPCNPGVSINLPRLSSLPDKAATTRQTLCTVQ